MSAQETSRGSFPNWTVRGAKMFEATRQVHSSTVITRNLGEKDVLGVMIVVFIVVPITLEFARGGEIAAQR